MQIHEPANELLRNFWFIWYLRLLHVLYVLKPFKFPKMFLHLSSLASYWRVLSWQVPCKIGWMDCSVDKELAGWLHPESCCQSVSRRSVVSRPHGSVFGPLLFNIFINNTEPMDLSEFLVCGQYQGEWCCWHKRRKGCHTKGHGTDLSIGPIWKSWSLFNKVRCKVLYLDPGSSQGQYRLGDKWIESSPEENDLQRRMWENWTQASSVYLQPGKPTESWAASKEVWTADQGRLFVPFWSAFLRPLLKYCIHLWGPHHKKEVELLE